MDWLSQHFKTIDNFPRPDWDAIFDYVDESHKEEDLHNLWCNITRHWMEKVHTSLKGNYAIHESDNFMLVTSESGKYVKNYLSFLERTLKKILSSLQGIANDDGYGKHIVIIFDDQDEYYSYLSYHYPEDGEYALSSGVYLNKGYGHFAFPYQDLSLAEAISAHEMTHALLEHLPIPLWLNEGMAVNIENVITGYSPLKMDKEEYAQHQAFWGEEEMQEFWSGDSFARPDEGNRLSYHLAQFAVHSLSQDFDSFVQFANKADYRDGGESAANEVYGGSLGNLITDYFGEGNWRPNPDVWGTKDDS